MTLQDYVGRWEVWDKGGFLLANPQDAGLETGHSEYLRQCLLSFFQSISVMNVTTQSTPWDSAQLLKVLFIYF